MRRIKWLWDKKKELGRIIKAIWITMFWQMTSRSWVLWVSSMTQWKIKMKGSSRHRSTAHSRSLRWIARIVDRASSKEKSYNYTLQLGKAKIQVRIHIFYRQIRWNLHKRTCNIDLKKKIMTSFSIWTTARLQSWAAAVRGEWQAWPQPTKASQPPAQPFEISQLQTNWLQMLVCILNSSLLRWTLLR